MSHFVAEYDCRRCGERFCGEFLPDKTTVDKLDDALQGLRTRANCPPLLKTHVNCPEGFGVADLVGFAFQETTEDTEDTE